MANSKNSSPDSGSNKDDNGSTIKTSTKAKKRVSKYQGEWIPGMEPPY